MTAGHALPDRYREILRFVRRRVRSSEDVEDVTQQVFADAAARLARSQASMPPSLAWLYTVARRRIADEARRRGRARMLPFDLVGELPVDEKDYGVSVLRTLEAGLASMPLGQRQVVVGRLLRGCTFAELARDLDATEEACRMRFMRGLRHLREAFEQEGLKP